MTFLEYNQVIYKMKIFFVSNTSWYLYNFRLPLLKEILSKGHAVFALAPRDKYVKQLQQNEITHVDIAISRSSINPIKDISLILKLITIYKEYRPDVIQHFTVKPVIYGTIAARLCHIKYIFNMVPGMGYVFTGTSFKKFWVQRIVRLLYQKTMNFSHHVFFQNRDDSYYFLKYKLVDKQKTSILPGTGVDIDKFRPGNIIKKKGVTFVIAARMLWDKGIGEFVEAARTLRLRYKNTNFWLLGPVDLQNPKGIRSEQLEDWNKEGVINYHGMTDNVKSYLERSDVIVLPSYYREGIPLSLLEGAAMGMPIITTESPGCRDVVEDGKNGYLVPIKNSVKLASAMEKFIVNPELISRMGKASRKMAVEKFDSKKIVKKILKYYPF